MVVDRRVLGMDLPLMVFVTLLFGLLALDGEFNKVDGAILLIGLVGYIWFQIKRSKAMKEEEEFEEEREANCREELCLFGSLMAIACDALCGFGGIYRGS